jgi:hypothetical protein
MTQKAQPGPDRSFLHEALFRMSRAINVYRDPGKLLLALANELRLVTVRCLRRSLRTSQAKCAPKTLRQTSGNPVRFTANGVLMQIDLEFIRRGVCGVGKLRPVRSRGNRHAKGP